MASLGTNYTSPSLLFFIYLELLLLLVARVVKAAMKCPPQAALLQINIGANEWPHGRLSPHRLIASVILTASNLVVSRRGHLAARAGDLFRHSARLGGHDTSKMAFAVRHLEPSAGILLSTLEALEELAPLCVCSSVSQPFDLPGGQE